MDIKKWNEIPGSRAVENWPYTNLHDLNLDWIINTTKEFAAEISRFEDNVASEVGEFENRVTVKIGEFEGTMQEYTNRMDTALATVDEKITYIDNFFSSLDVQQEINNKLDSMSADGSLAALLKPFADAYMQQDAPGIISAWLAAHITEPEGIVIDSSLSVPGAAADAAVVGGKISDLKGVFNANINESIEMVEDSYFSKYESFGDDDPHARRTTYIPVIPGETIETCSRANQNVYEIAFFDMNKKFDKSNSILGDTNINTREIVVPINDYYLIISSYNQEYKETICFARKRNNIAINYTEQSIDAFLKEEKHTVFESGGYHNSANMSFVNDSSGKSTGFIPVYPGQSLKYSTHLNNLGFELIYYSEYKLPLMSVSIIGDNSETEKEVTVPQYARYAKLWSYGSYKAYIKIGSPKVPGDEHFVYSGGYNTFAIFRKFVVCGDSLSVGHIDYGDSHTTPNLDYCWGRYIARDYNSECINCGASGLTAEEWLSNSNGLEKMRARGNKGQAYIIALGANEETGNIGSPSTINNINTFYGAYKAIYDAIRALNPTAKIFMLTLPIPWGDEWNAVNEGIRYIAENIGDESTFLVDLYKNYSKFFSSFPIEQTRTVHYLPNGYKLISKVIEYALDNIIVNNPVSFGNTHLIPCDPVNILDTSTTLENLESGMNAIFIAAGTVIGNYTIPNNCRGYAIKDEQNVNGFVTTFDATKYIILGNNGHSTWQFAVEH